MAEPSTTEVTVTQLTDDEFQVDVRDDEGQTRHTVRADTDAVDKFGHGHPAGTVVETAFRFLLEREPKVSILGSFELAIIEKFFPEYGAEMKRRLGDDSDA